MSVPSRATLKLQFATPEEARRILESLAPENAGYVRVTQDGATLIAEAEADAPLALLHTLDDLLACASAAQKAGRVATP